MKHSHTINSLVNAHRYIDLLGRFCQVELKYKVPFNTLDKNIYFTADHFK